MDFKNKIGHNVAWLVLLLIIVIAGVFFLFGKEYFMGPVSEKIIEEGRLLFHEGNYSGADIKYQQALKEAETKKDEASAKVNIGTARLRSDLREGIKILKEVSLDESYPKFERSSAISYAASVALASDLDFAKNYVFTGDIWSGFLPIGNFDREALELAVRRAFEWSADLYSVFPSEYRIAWWYSKQIIEGKTKSDEEIKQFVAIIKDRMIKGNVSLGIAQAAGTFPSRVVAGYILRGIALEGLYVAGESSIEEVKNTYNQALAIAEANKDDVEAYARIPYARYNLANFLVNRVKTYDTKEIRDILSPLYDYNINSSAFFGFLRSDAERSNKGIIALSKVDPRFKELLLSLGWKESDFK